MQQHTPLWVLIGLAALIVLCATVLAALGDPNPDWFRDLAFVALGAGGGVAVPSAITAFRTDATTSAVAGPPAEPPPVPPTPTAATLPASPAVPPTPAAS